MQNKKNRIILITLAIILIFLVIFLVIKLVNINKNKTNIEVVNTNNLIENETESNLINNEIQNNIISQNQTVKNNQPTFTEPNEPNINETNIQDNGGEEIDKSTIEKQEDNKDKAINIAKKDWGEDSTVYFTFDNVDSNGKYVVCVRKSTTTEALRWYAIDVNTEMFTIIE